MKNLFTLKLFKLSCLAIAISFSAISNSMAQKTKAAASLEQIRNGSATSPVNPAQWQNGNAGNQTAHYVEGHSIGYRALLTGLPLNTPITLVLGYDVRHSSKNAIDFLTNYDRLQSHGQFLTGGSHPTQEVVDPTIGTSYSGAPSDMEEIPKPTIVNGAGIPGTVWQIIKNANADKVKMAIWGGDITSIVYSGAGANLADAQSEQQISVTFTATNANAILAWGGHIANRNDWGTLGGVPLSAGGISGSPYHMRLINWNLGNLGNQDRSLSASAVIAPPGCALTGVTSTCADDATNTYSTTEVADIYNWSIINDNTNSASFDPAPTTSSTSVNVVAGSSAGSYTVKLVTVRNGITSTDVCEVTTMVTKPDKPAFTIQDATICGTITTPTITICSPVAGTYTLKQPNQADKTETYPTDDAVFTGVVPGIGFTLYVTVNGCKSEEAACGDQEQSGNCPNTQSKQTAPTISPTLGKAEAKDLIAYPVPFSESVTVEFKAKKAENYVINLYDLQGHLVRELKAGNAKAGEVIKVEVSGNGMAESMYLVRKVSKSGISTVKLLKKE